jgi:hypothetical protein
MGPAIGMLSLVNDLGAAAGARAAVLLFGYVIDWPIIGSIEHQCKPEQATAPHNTLKPMKWPSYSASGGVLQYGTPDYFWGSIHDAILEC